MTETPQAVSVYQAAARLGITSDAVRKRIRRGQLAGKKGEGGAWRVFLDGTAGQDTTGQTSETRQDRTRLMRQVPPDLAARIGALEQQLAEVTGDRDRWRQQAEHLARLLDQQQQLTLATVKALPAPSDQKPRRSWWPWGKKG